MAASKQLNIKKRSKGHGVVNPHLKEKTYQWLWVGKKNVNEKLTPEQMLKDFRKLCQWRAYMKKCGRHPQATVDGVTQFKMLLRVAYCMTARLGWTRGT